MTDLVSQLVGALEECLDDSRSVLADMEQKYGTNYRQDRLEFHRQVIAAAEAALTAAKAGGWVAVPVEPTPEMLNAGMTGLFDRKHPRATWEDCIAEMFAAMLAARPLPNPPKEQSAGGLGSVDAVANPLSPT